MSEAKAQAELLKNKYLKQIGDYYNIIDPNDLPVADGILLYYGKLFNDQVAENLKISGSIASGKIGELAVPTIIKFGNQYGIALGYKSDNPASKYYDFVNKGVKGFGGKKAKPKQVSADSPYAYKTPYANKKMATSILKWYRLGKAKANNESQKLAYATASAIKRDGLKTTAYFDNAVKKVFDKQFFETMSKALGNDVRLKIIQTNNEFKDGYNNK